MKKRRAHAVLSARFFERTLTWEHAFLTARLLERTLSWAHAFLSARFHAFLSARILERTLQVLLVVNEIFKARFARFPKMSLFCWFSNTVQFDLFYTYLALHTHSIYFLSKLKIDFAAELSMHCLLCYSLLYSSSIPVKICTLEAEIWVADAQRGQKKSECWPQNVQA